ncbi:Cation/H(+) antiporter 15 [Striga hermonthica]|uniref:Cation/H(+) antiporter 15 n=1 Tax=Striga hermonthica TaxID=68872 RepID=A0A9N7RBQ9_STRHE|nr:Cation/H(+) antiporter 15 [Striga hermonthica]
MSGSSIQAGTICFEQEQQTRWSRGVFFGESPFSSTTPLLLGQASLCALTAAVLNRFLAPLGQSAFISQILAGVLLGPTFFGSNPALRELFPVSSFYIVDTFAYFGVMFFLFIIGVKTDLSLVQKSGKKAVAIGVCTFVVPLLLNSMVGKLISNSVPMEPSLHRSIVWVASFQAVTSFHVIVCLLADLKLMNSDLGRLAIPSSMIGSLCSLFWTVVVFTGKQSVHGKEHTPALLLTFLAILVLFSVCIFRPIVRGIAKSCSSKSVGENHVIIIFILVLGSAIYGEYFGQHFILGPIIMGMVIPDGPPLGSALVDKLELFISSIVLPIFFVVSTARIDFSSISFRSFAIVECLALFSLLWKIAGVMLTLLFWKMPMRDAAYLAIILSNQGIVEVLMLERAKSIDLIDGESYSIMVLSISIFTGILAPIVKFSYKPSKHYAIGDWMTIQHADPTIELRILACLYYSDHTPAIINLFEASYPHPQAPICFYVVHLVELAGRSAPDLVAHHPGATSRGHLFSSGESDHIINALRFFEHENRGHATVYPFTSISPFASMHHDVCHLAADRRASLIIVLFHRHPLVHVSDEEAGSLRAVNQNIIRESPCSVGILVDRGASGGTALRGPELFRVGVLFIGGADDREALSYARRMAKHPNIHLTLVRFVANGSYECRPDEELVGKFQDGVEQMQVQSRRWFYREEEVGDSMGVVGVVRGMKGCFDLMVVGRRHGEESALLAGLRGWNEYPELGVVGDMLYSVNGNSKVSLLVVQQALSGEESIRLGGMSMSVREGGMSIGREEPAEAEAVMDMPTRLSDRRVWPAPTGNQLV